MRECWINVYLIGGRGSTLFTLADALNEARNMTKISKNKCIYRIHVRMK